MGRRTFDVVDLLELFMHWEVGRSQSQIADSLNLDANDPQVHGAAG